MASFHGQVGKRIDFFRTGSTDDFERWCAAVSAVPGGTISQSEAACLLGCTRQRIHQLVRSGEVRSLQFHGGFIRDVTMYTEIPVLDLLRYAERVRRPVSRLHAMKYVQWTDEVKEQFERMLSQETSASGSEQEWIRQRQELAAEIDDAWTTDQSAAEVLAEMRR